MIPLIPSEVNRMEADASEVSAIVDALNKNETSPVTMVLEDVSANLDGGLVPICGGRSCCCCRREHIYTTDLILFIHTRAWRICTEALLTCSPGSNTKWFIFKVNGENIPVFLEVTEHCIPTL